LQSSTTTPTAQQTDHGAALILGIALGMVVAGGVTVAIGSWQLWQMKTAEAAGVSPVGRSSQWSPYQSAPLVAYPASNPYQLQGEPIDAVAPGVAAPEDSTSAPRASSYDASGGNSDQSEYATAGALLPERQDVAPNAARTKMLQRTANGRE